MLANSFLDVTPGSGETVATHSAGNEHQVIVPTHFDGHLFGSRPLKSYHTSYIANVQNSNHWDLFNADASKIIRVLSVLHVPDADSLVAGINLMWRLSRTTSVGTGGTTLTPWLAEAGDAALDADVTFRQSPTGGATIGTTLLEYFMGSDESNVATRMAAGRGGRELVPFALRPEGGGKGIVLRQNQGMVVRCATAGATGASRWVITVVEN